MKNRYISDWDRYAALARQAATEGAVLLQNKNQALPIKEGEKVAVFGRMQFDYYKSGTISGGMVNTKYTIGILDALKEENIRLDQSLMDTYQEWIREHPFDRGSGWAQEPWSQEEMPLSADIVNQEMLPLCGTLCMAGRNGRRAWHGICQDQSAETR